MGLACMSLTFRFRSLLCLASYGQEELELGWQLVLCVQAIREVNSSDSAVGMNLHSTKVVRENSCEYLRVSM